MKRISKTRILMYNKNGKNKELFYYYYYYFFDVKDGSMLNKRKKKTVYSYRLG